MRYYSTTAGQMTLQADITAGSTSIQVDSTAGLPVTFPYTLILDYGGAAEEVVDVTAAAGTTLTVTRGVDGTAAQAHTTGASIRHGITARDLRESREHEAATAAHGVAEVVGATETQTLDNKTFQPDADHVSATFKGLGGNTEPIIEVTDADGNRMAAWDPAALQSHADASNLWWRVRQATSATFWKRVMEVWLRGDADTITGNVVTGATGKFLRLFAADGTTELFSVDAAGAVAGTSAAFTGDVTAGNLGSSAGATPTLLGTTSNPALGSTGVAEQSISRSGKQVTVTYHFLFGGTGISAGSGYYEVTLPSTPVDQLKVTGQGYYVDSSAFLRKIAGVTSVGSSRYRLMAEGTSSGFVTNNTPWAWADQDRIVLTVTYEEA